MGDFLKELGLAEAKGTAQSKPSKVLF